MRITPTLLITLSPLSLCYATSLQPDLLKHIHHTAASNYKPCQDEGDAEYCIYYKTDGNQLKNVVINETTIANKPEAIQLSAGDAKDIGPISTQDEYEKLLGGDWSFSHAIDPSDPSTSNSCGLALTNDGKADTIKKILGKRVTFTYNTPSSCEMNISPMNSGQCGGKLFNPKQDTCISVKNGTTQTLALGLTGNTIGETTHATYSPYEVNEIYVPHVAEESNSVTVESIDGQQLKNCYFSDNGHSEKYKGQKIGIILGKSGNQYTCHVTQSSMG